MVGNFLDARHCPPQRLAGFGLIELLVAIAIIASWMVILLPSLKETCEEARVAA